MVDVGSPGQEGSNGGSELSPFKVDWLDSEVVKATSVYTSSFVQLFVDRVDILDPSLPNDVFGFH